MEKIYSYVLCSDDGAAPNPFGGICTLTICKPRIRKNAQIGDWVVGTGSINHKLMDFSISDYSNYLIYAMKITDKKYLREYDNYCKSDLNIKIPKLDTDDLIKQHGDCIYDFSNGIPAKIRDGVHFKTNYITDTSGKYSLLSAQFYYFGRSPIKIPEHLKFIIKHGRGHKTRKDPKEVKLFEDWITTHPQGISDEPIIFEDLRNPKHPICYPDKNKDDKSEEDYFIKRDH
jgi:hypothetical protein